MDTVSPLTRGLHKQRFSVTVVDQFTKSLFVIPVKSKEVIPVKVICFMVAQETKYHRKLSCVFSNQGYQFTANWLNEFLSKQGTIYEFGAPNIHNQDGIVKRASRTTSETMQVLLVFANIKEAFWPWAKVYAATLWNITPKKFQVKSPHEILTGACHTTKEYDCSEHGG